MKWRLKKYPLYINGLMQSYPDIKLGMPSLSKSVVSGNLIFLSGIGGTNQETGRVKSHKFEKQLFDCLDNIRIAVEEAGGSMDNLVKLLIMVKSIDDCPVMWEAMLAYYRKYAPSLIKEPPAVTIIPVSDFINKGCLIEIDTIAVISKSSSDFKMTKYPMRHRITAHTYLNINPAMPLLSESVSVGNLLFLSGIAGENPGSGRIETEDFDSQMDIGFEKIMKAFGRAGSSVSNIIKTWHLMANVDSMLVPSRDEKVSNSPASDRLWKRELEHYEMYAPELLEDFPGSTFLKLKSLENPNAMSEIDLIGVIDQGMPGWKVKKYPLYYGKRGFPRHIGEIKKYYSNTVVVGNLIFISGQTPTDQFTGRIETDTFEGQMKVTLDNLRLAIEDAGGSLDNLIKTYILMPNSEHYSVMRRLEVEYYQRHAPLLVREPPASTLIQPLNLASPKMMIEIDAIGFVPG